MVLQLVAVLKPVDSAVPEEITQCSRPRCIPPSARGTQMVEQLVDVPYRRGGLDGDGHGGRGGGGGGGAPHLDRRQ